MTGFLPAAFAYPTALLTALLGVVVVYWLLALVGLVDFEGDGLEVQADADAGELSTLATYLVALGLNGVPFSIVASLIVLIGWTVCALGAQWLLPWVPTALLGFVAGTALLLVSLALAVVLTARAVRPLRPLFVTHNAPDNAALVGQRCTVLTGTVDERVGRAEVAQRGASLNVRVWAPAPNAFTKGSSARIVDYDALQARYRIEPDF